MILNFHYLSRSQSLLSLLFETQIVEQTDTRNIPQEILEMFFYLHHYCITTVAQKLWNLTEPSLKPQVTLYSKPPEGHVIKNKELK